jgi:nicotinamidase-related amidase
MGAALGYEQFLVEDAVYEPRSPYIPKLKNRVELISTDEVVSLAERAEAAPRQDEPGCAMVLVDLQNDFIHSQGALARYGHAQRDDAAAERIIANNRRLVAAMRARGWPVVFVKLIRRPDDLDSVTARSRERMRPIPSEAHFAEPGSWGAELVDGLEPAAGELIVEKRGHSAFASTPLHRALRNLRVRRVLATGGAISGCLSDTVREAAGLGYAVTLVSDATYPPDPSSVEALADLADVRTTEDVLSELEPLAASGRPAS